MLVSLTSPLATQLSTQCPAQIDTVTRRHVVILVLGKLYEDLEGMRKRFKELINGNSTVHVSS